MSEAMLAGTREKDQALNVTEKDIAALQHVLRLFRSRPSSFWRNLGIGGYTTIDALATFLQQVTHEK